MTSYFSLFTLLLSLKLDFFFWIITHSIFSFLNKESSTMWIDSVIFFSSYIGEWLALTRLRPCLQCGCEPPRRREAPVQVESDSRDKECVSCSVSPSPMPPHQSPPTPLQIPPSHRARPLFLQQELAPFLQANGLVGPGLPCNVNLGSSGVWQKMYKNKKRGQTPPP